MRLGRHRFPALIASIALASATGVSLLSGAVPSAAAATQTTTLSRQAIARKLLASPAGRELSGSAITALRLIAGKTGVMGASSLSPLKQAEALDPRLHAILSAPTNTRVNDPSTDGLLGVQDMTTQSEPTIAVSGSNIVVGYNDDGTSSPFATSGMDLTGYSWSDDSGATWHDSQLPNPVRGINVGDPVLAVAPDGTFYYASLADNFSKCCLDVVVGKSVDGGQTFSTPVYVASRGVPYHHGQVIFLADKPSIAVGPDPSNLAQTAVYVAWTDFGFSMMSFQSVIPIDVTSSTDGGTTWSVPHPAAQVISSTGGLFPGGRVTLQEISGSTMAVEPSTGELFMAFERFVSHSLYAMDYKIHQEMVVSSSDGGATFTYRSVVARPNKVGKIQAPASCGDTLNFGPDSLVRVQEFPVLAVGPGQQLTMAYNSTDSSGVSQIRLASSSDLGVSWTHTALTSGGEDAFMPAIGADPSGVAVSYYQRTGNSTLQTMIASSVDGTTFTTKNLSSTDFGVPYTVPNFDPFSAWCYMGDYNGVAVSGGTAYSAWGDNRDMVTDALWPTGRPDPNIYFAQLPVGP